MSSDESVMSTNDDAATCKRFAVQVGYWKDPFIQYFIKLGERKAPEINRGYFARVQGIKYLVDLFIKRSEGSCQIVSLGAGFDTLFWRLKAEGVSNLQGFVEVDLPGVTSRKVYYIRNRKPLLNALVNEDEDIKFSTCDLHAGSYHLIGGDLRQVTQLEKKLEGLLEPCLPTLFLSECVLVYLETQYSDTLLSWLSSRFKDATFVNYEQVNMGDRFGEVMQENLKKRSCCLLGVSACGSVTEQQARFLQNGWHQAVSEDMSIIYQRLPRKEVERIEKLEFLDEGELLEQLLQHYCLTVAQSGGDPKRPLLDMADAGGGRHS